MRAWNSIWPNLIANLIWLIPMVFSHWWITYRHARKGADAATERHDDIRRSIDDLARLISGEWQ
jgi:hypothetical protein